MFISQLTANLFKVNQARLILLIIPVLFLVAVLCGQVFADEKQSLLEAAKDGNQEQVALLIRKGADVNQTDSSGYTPLMWAARYNHLEVSKQLVKAGALIGINNKNGLTAIQLAARFESFEIARFLEHSYSPSKEILSKEKLINTNNEKPDVTIGVYDRNQDGYLDPVKTRKLLPEYNKSTIRLTLNKCDQSKKHKTLSAWWGFYSNKWLKYKIVNDSIVFSNRKGYSIEINFITEKNQEVLLVGYRHKQGRSKILKRIARDTQIIYEFLCEVPEVADKLYINESGYESEVTFGSADCNNQRHVGIVITLIALRKNNWKNIRIHNEGYISAEYNGSQLHRKVLIKYIEDWKYGQIYLSGVDKNATLKPERIERYLNKYKKRLSRDIAKSYKSFCHI